MPNFTNFHLDLSEFSVKQLPKITLPEITVPSLDMLPNINMSEVNKRMPDFRAILPKLVYTYDYTIDRASDTFDYAKQQLQSYFNKWRL